MILTSTTQTVPFTPPWVEGTPQAVTFQLRAGSIIERGQMEAELSGEYQAGKVWAFELAAAIKSGLLALLGDDPDVGHLIELFEMEGGDEASQLSDADRQRLVEVRGILGQHWPEYRALLAQIERRREIAPIVALRRFCTAIEGVKTFERNRQGLVTDATLAQLDPLVMMAAGNRAFSLQYGGDQEGNLSQPSSSDDGQPTSSSDEPSKAVGKSKACAGRKIPA